MHTDSSSIDVFILVSNNSTGALVASFFKDIDGIHVSYDISKDVIERLIPPRTSIKWRLGKFLRYGIRLLSHRLGIGCYKPCKQASRLRLCISRYALDSMALHAFSYPQACYLHIIDDVQFPSRVHLHNESYVENLGNKKRLYYLEQSFSCVGLKQHSFLNLSELFDTPALAFIRLEELTSRKDVLLDKEALGQKVAERLRGPREQMEARAPEENAMRFPAFDASWFLQSWSNDCVTFTNYEALFYSNPYIRRLRKELHQKGVRVIFEACVPYQRDTRIKKLHIQWYNNLIRNYTLPFVPRFASAPVQSSLRFLQYLLWRQRLKHYAALSLPIIWTVHDFHGLARENSALDLKLRELVMDNAQHIIVHNQAIGELIAELKPSVTMHYTPHPHYIDCYPHSISKEDARRRLGYSQDDVLFLMQGIMRPYKGTVQAIEAFKALSHQSCKLLIAGRLLPDFYENQCSLAADEDTRIKILNKDIPDDELQDYYKACDAVLFSFSQTTTSGSLLLAMGFQCPIVAPEHDILRTTLPEVQQPYLFECASIEEETKALERMFHCSPQQKEALGKANLDSIQNHNWEDLAEALVSVYKEL